MKGSTQRQRAIAKALTLLLPYAPYADTEKIRADAGAVHLRALPPSIAVWLATVAHVRHAHTDYENLLAEGYDRDSARFFVIDQISKRYTIEVRRRPLAAPAGATPGGAGAKAGNVQGRETAAPADAAPAKQGEAEARPAQAPDPAASGQVLRTVTYEGHAPVRFALALGIAQLFRSSSQSFALVDSVAAGADTVRVWAGSTATFSLSDSVSHQGMRMAGSVIWPSLTGTRA